jgi:hypothetical protein
LSKSSFKERISQEARELPGKSHGHFRKWFRKVWDLRGGGLYACGFALTFVALEAGSFIEDFKEIGLLFDGEIIQFILNFIIDSFGNTLQAFIWPANVAQMAPPYGAIALGVAFWLFPIYVKKHIEAWLFADDDVEQADANAELPEEK